MTLNRFAFTLDRRSGRATVTKCFRGNPTFRSTISGGVKSSIGPRFVSSKVTATTWRRYVNDNKYHSLHPLATTPTFYTKDVEGVDASPLNNPNDHYVIVDTYEGGTWLNNPMCDPGLLDQATPSGQITIPDGSAPPYAFLAGVPTSSGYGNLRKYIDGNYAPNKYFRVRFLENGFPYATVYNSVTNNQLSNVIGETYYSCGNVQMSIGRTLYYYLYTNNMFSNGNATGYFWVNLYDNDDWVVLADMTNTQQEISGFRIVNPNDLFWSAYATSGVKTRWDTFMDSCYQDSFRTTVTKRGVMVLTGEINDSPPPYYFFHCGTWPGGNHQSFFASTTRYMFYQFLEALYSVAPSVGVDVYVSFDDIAGCVDYRLIEAVAEDVKGRKRIFVASSQLNGANGEVTGTDDMPPKKQKTNHNKQKDKKKNKKKDNKKVPVLQQGLIMTKPPRSTIPHTIKLTKATRAFLRAAIDPFSMGSDDVYLPIGQTVGSQRVRGFMRILVSIGSAGVGFIGVTPCVVNDFPCVWYTNNSYAGTTFAPWPDVAAPNPPLSTGVAAGVMSNLPYSSAQVYKQNAQEALSQDGVNCTCVAWGVSVANASAEMNLGGTITAYTDVTRCSLYGASQADLSTFMSAQVVLGSRQRVYLSMYPFESLEMEYSPEIRVSSSGSHNLAAFYPMNTTFGSSATTQTNNPSISNLIMFTGVPGSQYLCHIVGYNEYFGSETQALNRNKIDDPDGLARAINVLGRARTLCNEQGKTLASAASIAEKMIARDMHEY